MNTENTDESEELQALSMDERLMFCSNCKNRSFNAKDGLICALSGEKPKFEYECESYSEDDTALRRNSQIEGEKIYHEKSVRPAILLIAIVSSAIVCISFTYFEGRFSTLFIILAVVAFVKYFDK